MQAYIGVLVLCIISAAVSCAIYGIQNRKRFNIDGLIKAFVFYIMMFYTILSLFKTVLGYGMLKLTDTFDAVSWKTYLHYSLPLMIISIMAPLVIKKLLREKTSDFINLTISVIAGIYSVVYLVFGRNNNLLTVCISFIGVIMAFIILFFNKKEVQYCTRQNIKARFASVVPVMLFWIITMVLFLPNELYYGNANDMTIPYGIFIRTLLLGALIYFAVYTILLVYFLTEKQLTFVCEIIFAISIGCYLQGMILNGKMNVMDGSVQVWSALTTVVNVAIWVVIIGIVIALKFIIKKNTDKIYSTICIYLSVIQLVTWGYLGITADIKTFEDEFFMTTEARFELDSKHNVLVFVLDSFDGQMLDRLIADQTDILEPLKDFTWYKNTSSLYAFTGMSVPYLLTDVEWQYNMEDTQYRDYAFQNDKLLKDIVDKNYDIGVYTGERFISNDIKDVVRNYSDVTVEGWNYYGIFTQMFDCSRYKSYPFALKNIYWYADGTIVKTMRDTGIHIVTDDEPFYYELVDSGLHVRKSSKYDGVYRFYHLRGMHIPYEPDILSQGKRCMEILYEYLEQLKALGLYDEATIIITADHGQNFLAMEDQRLKYNFDMDSSPILFVKKSGQTGGDDIKISMAPVSHSEFAATVIEAVYGDALDYGDTFDDIDENEQRTRYFIYKRDDDIPYSKYSINGYVRDWNNWNLEEAD